MPPTYEPSESDRRGVPRSGDQSVDADHPRVCADVIAGREQGGNPISGYDGQIAAICRSQAATLATRNTEDFIDTGLSLIDPWQQTAA